MIRNIDVHRIQSGARYYHYAYGPKIGKAIEHEVQLLLKLPSDHPSHAGHGEGGTSLQIEMEEHRPLA